jgi:hypothetical protein
MGYAQFLFFTLWMGIVWLVGFWRLNFSQSQRSLGYYMSIFLHFIDHFIHLIVTLAKQSKSWHIYIYTYDYYNHGKLPYDFWPTIHMIIHMIFTRTSCPVSIARYNKIPMFDGCTSRTPMLHHDEASSLRCTCPQEGPSTKPGKLA